jgi:NADH-quinone oxidoreductase subunit A
MSQLVPVVVLALFVVAFGSALLWLSSKIAIRGRPDPVKGETYECGLPSDQSGPTKMPIKYYLTAILFILFDIEIIFMYPWALTYGEFLSSGHGLYIFLSMAFFLLVFVFGLFWEVKSKALDWE